jgi:flagellar motor component MotA
LIKYSLENERTFKTKVTVRFEKQKTEKNGTFIWKVILYMISGKKTPQRIREYLNRSVTTVEFDKKRTARTDSTGTKLTNLKEMTME